jgi:hypothetical protein
MKYPRLSRGIVIDPLWVSEEHLALSKQILFYPQALTKPRVGHCFHFDPITLKDLKKCPP